MTQAEKLYKAGLLKDPADLTDREEEGINSLEDPEVEGLISVAKTLGLKGTLHDWGKGGGSSDLF